MTAMPYPNPLPYPNLPTARRLWHRPSTIWLLNLGSIATLVATPFAVMYGIGGVIFGADTESNVAYLGVALLALAAILFITSTVLAVFALIATIGAAGAKINSHAAIIAAWIITGLNVTIHIAPFLYRLI